jgi:opacity protein-like surface antigen
MKSFGVLMAAALLSLAVCANAQVKQGSQEAGVNVGLAVPLSNTTLGGSIPSTTLGAVGPMFGFNYDYMALSNVSVGGDFSYRSFGGDSVGGGANLSGDDWTLMVTGKYQFLPNNQLRPYGLLGLGLGNEYASVSGRFGGSASGTGFAYAIGGGVEYDLNSQWSVGAELRWSGISASLSNSVGSQTMDSLDLVVSGHYKFGAL